MVLQLLGMMASMIAVKLLGAVKDVGFSMLDLPHRLHVKLHLRQMLPINPSCMSELLPWQDHVLLSQEANTEKVSIDASLRG